MNPTSVVQNSLHLSVHFQAHSATGPSADGVVVAEDAMDAVAVVEDLRRSKERERKALVCGNYHRATWGKMATDVAFAVASRTSAAASSGETVVPDIG